MKIATALFKYFPYGGLQLDFRRIVQELIARGHTVICFTGSWEGDPIEGLDLRIIPLKSISNHARAAEFEKKVHAQLNDLSVDRFVAFNRMGGADLYFAADNCLLPAWQKKHSSFILNLLPRYRTFLRQERAVFGPESRTKILYLVESQKQEYQTCYGTDDKRFLPLPPGMNPDCVRKKNAPEIRKRKRTELGVKDDEILLILVAAQFMVKGADRVIRTLKELPENCRLLLCGDEKADSLYDLAKSLKINEKRIIHLGKHQNIPELLCAADLMVHPARLEAAGSVLIEGIASGVPVICSGICGFAPYVKESSGIVLKKEFDQEELTAGVKAALSDLSAMTEQVREYGKTVDFCKRASVAADYIENK